MIHITDREKCCGCEACIQRCPQQCITLHEDGEGFLYPETDEGRCIDCGLCEKVCPVIFQGTGRRPLNVYAAKNPDEEKVHQVVFLHCWQRKFYRREEWFLVPVLMPAGKSFMIIQKMLKD